MKDLCYACGHRKHTTHCHHCDRDYCAACLSKQGVRERFANNQMTKETKPHPVKMHPSLCEAVSGVYDKLSLVAEDG